jgi:hypothetical protein
MKIDLSYEVDLKPIGLPNYIQCEEGSEVDVIHVTKLPKETLETLAADFRERLLLRAGYDPSYGGTR